MQQVQPNDMVIGENYYIQMVGRFLNQYRESGKALGIHFIGLTTWNQVDQSLDYGLSQDLFNDDDILVQFQHAHAINNNRACGICHYRYYRASNTNGFVFYKFRAGEKMKEKRHQIIAYNKFINDSKLSQFHKDYTMRGNIRGYLSGDKTRRRRTRSKTHGKTRNKIHSKTHIKTRNKTRGRKKKGKMKNT